MTGCSYPGTAAGRPSASPSRRRSTGALAFAPLLAMMLAACDRDPTTPPAGSGAADRSSDTLLPASGKPVQPRLPMANLRIHLDAFHFRSGEMAAQRSSQHYCGPLGEEVAQCVLFDGVDSDARLVGIEYMISERLFEKLPDEEKPYWHSHAHEVKSGAMLAPVLPEQTETELVGRLVRTYGKAWQLWDPERGAQVAMGVPQLLMGFTHDGQLDPVLHAERDRLLGVAGAEKKRQRAGIPAPPIAQGADAWQQGRIAAVRGEVETATAAR